MIHWVWILTTIATIVIWAMCLVIIFDHWQIDRIIHPTVHLQNQHSFKINFFRFLIFLFAPLVLIYIKLVNTITWDIEDCLKGFLGDFLKLCRRQKAG